MFCSSRALLRSACPIRVWNGIFVAGDRRAKRDLKTISLRRDRKSETTTREKWPLKLGSIEIQPHFVAWLAADHRIRWQEPSGSLELSHSQAARSHTLQFVNRHQMLQHIPSFWPVLQGRRALVDRF